jgi:uncharacterized membrane protein
MSVAGIASGAPLRHAPRWLLGALFTSLAVNLIVIGLVAGALWRFHAPVWPGVTPSLIGYASVLGPDRRKQLWEETEMERRELRPLRREVRAAREETVKALAAVPYDRQAFVAAQETLADAEAKARRAVQSLYLKLANSLTPEERQGFPHWRERHRLPVHSPLDDNQTKDAQNSAARR